MNAPAWQHVKRYKNGEGATKCDAARSLVDQYVHIGAHAITARHQVRRHAKLGWAPGEHSAKAWW